MLESFIDWALSLVDKFGYLGIFLATALESFFAPLPSEFLLPMVGFLASQGEMNLFLGASFAAVGSYVGTLPFYVIAYKYKESVFEKLIKKYGKYFLISMKEVEKTEELFDKHGKKFVFFGRLIPGIRTIVSIPAGIAKMNFTVYTALTLAGSFMWNMILGTAGYFAGENYENILPYLDKFESLVWFTLAIVITLYIYLQIKEWRRITNDQKVD